MVWLPSFLPTDSLRCSQRKGQCGVVFPLWLHEQCPARTEWLEQLPTEFHGGKKSAYCTIKCNISSQYMDVPLFFIHLCSLLYSVYFSGVWFVVRPRERLVGEETDSLKTSLHVLWRSGRGKLRSCYIWVFSLFFQTLTVLHLRLALIKKTYGAMFFNVDVIILEVENHFGISFSVPFFNHICIHLKHILHSHAIFIKPLLNQPLFNIRRYSTDALIVLFFELCIKYARIVLVLNDKHGYSISETKRQRIRMFSRLCE